MNKQVIELNIELLKGNVDGFKALLAEQPHHPMGGSIEHQIDALEMAISALTQQLNNRWVPVSERLPEPKEWCWVWFDYAEDGHSSGNGFCERMYLSSNGKWMKNTLSAVKDEDMDCIRAWRPYFEPEPYIE